MWGLQQHSRVGLQQPSRAHPRHRVGSGRFISLDPVRTDVLGKGIAMRRFVFVVMAGLMAMALAAPVSAGPNVSNTSGSATVAEAYWYQENGDSSSSGYLSFWREARAASAMVSYWIQEGTWVDCTPADPNDDFFGFQGSWSSGFGEGSLTVSKGYGSAVGSGVVDVYVATVDECAGTYEESFASGIAVSLGLTAAGPKIMYRGTSSFHVPSEYNSHSSYSSTGRMAAGTVTIGSGAPIAADGAIGIVSWRDHANG